MASITAKRIKGKTYYYARECKRVNGKPKIVWQKYLGKADDIIARATAPHDDQRYAEPEHAISAEFGAAAALYDMAQRLGIRDCIDRHVPKRGRGPSVGTYLLVATLNRCTAPCSKAAIAQWFAGTALRRFIDIEPKQLSSQRFWDNMDRVSPQAIKAIEADLAQRLVREFKLDLSHVLFDATNFFTFIDSFNTRCDLAQRGKSKQERKALRIVGLALLVTADFHVPLLHHTYPGNQTDAPTFESLTDELVARYRQIACGTEHVTLIFDKGNNSKDNLETIEDSPYHFVGSLVPTQHPELLQIPMSQLRSLDEKGLAGTSAYRTRKIIFGVSRTVLVTYNENLFVAQSRTLLREIAKRQQRLRTIQNRLRRWHQGKAHGGNPPTVASTKTKVNALLKARHMKDLFGVKVTERNGLPSLTYRFDKRAWEELQNTLLGKNLLFTDNNEWTDADIVRGYRSQHHVESAFRCVKDPHHIAIRPQHHWTDQKIRAHVFCCVLALTLCSLLRRELHHKGIDLSIPKLIDTLKDIREVAIVYPPHKKDKAPTIRTTFSQMSELQRLLFDTLGLQQYRQA